MVSVLAASAERRGERVKGRNGVAECGWCARSRPIVLHDSAAARELTTASMEGLGPASLPDAERSANGNCIGEASESIGEASESIGEALESHTKNKKLRNTNRCFNNFFGTPK